MQQTIRSNAQFSAVYLRLPAFASIPCLPGEASLSSWLPSSIPSDQPSQTFPPTPALTAKSHTGSVALRVHPLQQIDRCIWSALAPVVGKHSQQKALVANSPEAQRSRSR